MYDKCHVYNTYVSRERSNLRPTYTSARCEALCRQQQVEFEWNTEPHNCEADAQEYLANSLLTMF